MNHSLDNSLLVLLLQSSSIAGRLFSEFAAPKSLEGLTPKQFVILAAIGAGEAISQQDLSQRLAADSTKVGEIIGRLQSRGLVARSRAISDDKAFLVRLTDIGRETLSVALSVVMRVDEQLRSTLATGKYIDLTTQLRTIVESGRSQQEATAVPAGK